MDIMDMDDSQNSYRPLTADGSKFNLIVDELRRRPFRTAAVCLGLLCVLLLAAVIGQGVRFSKAEQHLKNNYKALTKQTDNLQTNLNTVLKERTEQQNTQAHLQSSNGDLQREKDRVSAEFNALKQRNGALTKERNTLKASEKQLQADKSVLTKERDQLKANQDRLQTNNDALTKARDLVQTDYNSAAKLRNELRASYSSTIKERDVLQNKYNNVTRATKQLNISYEALLVEVRKLEDTHNTTKREKEQLESDHWSKTKELEYERTNMNFCKTTVNGLQPRHNDLVEERDLLRVSYDNITAGRDLLISTYANCTLERDGLQARQGNLAAERDHWQQEVERLNATNSEKREGQPTEPSGPGGGPTAAPGQGPVPVIPTGPQESLVIPYEHTLRNGVYDKLLITVCGTIKPNPDRIKLEFMTENGDIAFHFNPRFNHNSRKVIKCNTKQSGHWGPEQDEDTFPFTAGQAFEIRVTCTSQEFQVAVNGAHVLSYKHRIPNLQSITRLRVDEDLTLSSVTETRLPGQGPVPVTPTAPQESLVIPYDHILRNGVYDKLLITVCGTIKPNPDRIKLDFFTENGDFAFHFNPRFNDEGLGHSGQKIICNSRHSGQWGQEQVEDTFPFTAGQAFEIRVTCTSQEFQVAVNGAHLLSFKHRMHDLQSITRLRVDQDLTLSSVTETRLPGQGPVPVTPTAPQESLVIPYEHTLRNGVYDKLLITICGTIKPNPDKFNLDFMTENGDIAFHFNPRFKSQEVVCNSLLSGNWGPRQVESTFPFTAGQAFEIKVTCTSQEFQVAVNGSHLLSFKYRIPNLQSITRLRVINDLTLSSVTETRLP